MFAFKCTITAPIQWIGHAEEADYAEMAESILQGKGISVDFIGYAYWYSPLRYPEITHPDAHYPPLYSFLIVPFFLTMGKSAFAAKIPAMFLASVVLPWVMYGLTTRLSGNRLAGVAAALASLFYPALFSHSLRSDDDVLFPTMLLASSYFLLRAREHPRGLLVAGVLAGLAYYSKGTAILLLPAFGFYFLVRSGWRLWRDRQAIRFFLIALLVMLPWFIRTTVHFGHPLFSTEQYAAGYIGYKSWEVGTYSLYWDQKRPTLLDKFREAGLRKVWQKSLEFLKQYAWWEFVDIHEKWRQRGERTLLTAFTGLAALAGWLVWGLGSLARLLGRWRWLERWKRLHRVLRQVGGWYRHDYLLLWLVGTILTLFQGVCWEPIRRLAFPGVLINMAVGWTTYARLAEKIFRPLKHRSLWVAWALILLMAPVLARSVGAVWHDRQKAGWPYRDTNRAWIEAGYWLRDNAPGSVTMTRNPWELHFYSGEKAVQIPLADLEKTVKVMRFYKVTHLIPQVDIRPALKPLVEGKIPGLRLVYDGGLKIYAVDLDALPHSGTNTSAVREGR